MGTATIQTTADCEVHTDSGQIIEPGATAICSDGERCKVLSVCEDVDGITVAVEFEDGVEDNFSASVPVRGWQDYMVDRVPVCGDLSRIALRKLPAKLRDPDEVSPVRRAADNVMTARAALIRAAAILDGVEIRADLPVIAPYRPDHWIRQAVLTVDEIHEGLSGIGRALGIALPAGHPDRKRASLDALSIASQELRSAHVLLCHPDAEWHRHLIEQVRDQILDISGQVEGGEIR